MKAPMPSVDVGVVASSDAGVIRVAASPGQVNVTHSASVPLSPALARELGSLLVLAADVAEGEHGQGGK